MDSVAPDAEEQVNQRLQRTVFNMSSPINDKETSLGRYNDKKKPAQVPEQFKYMLSYSKALPKYLPDFYNYLLTYPDGRPANVENTFYWSKVKFGLKPTLRVVHVLTLRGKNAIEPAYIIAEKQLYSSHDFETALDLTFCAPKNGIPSNPVFTWS